MARSIFGTVFGPSGAGKTLGTAVGCLDGIFLAYSTGIESLSRYGIDAAPYALKAGDPVPEGSLAWVDLAPFSRFKSSPVAVLTRAVKVLGDRGVSTIVGDDLSLLLVSEAVWWETVGGITGWGIWNMVKANVIALRDEALAYPETNILFTMHEAEPRFTKEEPVELKRPGGPHVPGYDISDWFPGMMTLCAQLCATNAQPWPYSFDVTPDPSGHWVRHDKHNIPVRRGPWHFGAIRRACDLPSSYGSFPWLEAAVTVAIGGLEALGFPQQEFDRDAARSVILATAKEVPKGFHKHVRLAVDEAACYLQLVAKDPIEAMLDDLAARATKRKEKENG